MSERFPNNRVRKLGNQGLNHVPAPSHSSTTDRTALAGAKQPVPPLDTRWAVWGIALVINKNANRGVGSIKATCKDPRSHGKDEKRALVRCLRQPLLGNAACVSPYSPAAGAIATRCRARLDSS